MEFPTLVRWNLYIQSGPRPLNYGIRFHRECTISYTNIHKHTYENPAGQLYPWLKPQGIPWIWCHHAATAAVTWETCSEAMNMLFMRSLSKFTLGTKDLKFCVMWYQFLSFGVLYNERFEYNFKLSAIQKNCWFSGRSFKFWKHIVLRNMYPYFDDSYQLGVPVPIVSEYIPSISAEQQPITEVLCRLKADGWGRTI